MSVARRLVGTRVCICAGAGGVGKTTTSAAIALGLAGAGKRVAVVTIDPAQRLSDALGIEADSERPGEPQQVDPARLAGAGLAEGGELWAMTLDPKQTFDGLVERLAPTAEARGEILANPIYRRLSQAVAGSQEFTAVATLYDLHRSGRFDAIVLDTPPSRNALDFLDAPDRLTGLLEGRGIGVALTTTGFAARVTGRGSELVFGALGRLTGIELMRDIQSFFTAFASVLDGFRERAGAVSALLADPGTRFLVVAAPEREPAAEAVFFTDKLAASEMPFGGLIVNRVTPWADEPPTVDSATLERSLGGDRRLAAKVMRTVAEQRALAERDRTQVAWLSERTGDDEPILVPRLSGEIHDVEGLCAVRDWLFAEPGERARRLAALAV